MSKLKCKYCGSSNIESEDLGDWIEIECQECQAIYSATEDGEIHGVYYQPVLDVYDQITQNKTDFDFSGIHA